MNGHTQMPTITFGDGCDYSMLDTLLINRYGGLAVRVWFKQNVCLTAIWKGQDFEDDRTRLLAWDLAVEDYRNSITVPTDDIIRIEVL